MSVGLPLADEVTAVFARASRLLLTEDTVAHALKLITEAVTAAVPGAIGAGVSLPDSSGKRSTAAASDGAVRQAALTLSDRLRDPPAQRDTINMAKGLLMARTGDGGDGAFRQLMALSSQAGKPLVQAAADLPASARPAGI